MRVYRGCNPVCVRVCVCVATTTAKENRRSPPITSFPPISNSSPIIVMKGRAAVLLGRRATANTGVGGAKGVERDVRSQVLVVRENSVAKTGSTTVEEKEEGGGGGGSHQEGARLVASGVEREKREKVKRGMKGGRERRKERK